jgi:predicted lipoprotein with Yx(FWY)xxD motif
MSIRTYSLFLVAAVAACESPRSTTGAYGDAGAGRWDVAVHADAQGSYLVDAEGRPLYVFAKDVAGGASNAISNCTGACSQNWIPVHAARIGGDGINVAAFGQATSATDAQTTYRGWPLYLYAKDSGSSPTGDGLGGQWFVARAPFYTMMVHEDGSASSRLVDGEGRSLYVFRADTQGTSASPAVSACTSDACRANWSAVPSTELRLPAGVLVQDEFGSVAATSQRTYAGWPLYYFAGDTMPGDAKGAAGMWELAAVE